MNKALTIREKSTLLTIISSFIPSIVVMILGVIKSRYIIEFLGFDDNFNIYDVGLRYSR